MARSKNEGRCIVKTYPEDYMTAVLDEVPEKYDIVDRGGYAKFYPCPSCNFYAKWKHEIYSVCEDCGENNGDGYDKKTPSEVLRCITVREVRCYFLWVIPIHNTFKVFVRKSV